MTERDRVIDRIISMPSGDAKMLLLMLADYNLTILCKLLDWHDEESSASD